MQHVRLIFLLAALSMLGALSIDAYIPALPAIAADFGATAAATQQTLTVYLFAYAVMTLFYGTLSDSFGRRPVVMGAMGLYIVASFGAAWAESLGALLFFRVLQGLSAGAGAVIGRAIVNDRLSGREAQKAFAYISMLFGLAPALAPVLGGWLLAISGWRMIFGVIALFALLLWAACLRWLPESLPHAERHRFHLGEILQRYAEAVRHPSFLLCCLGTAFSFSGVALYIGAAPFFVMEVLGLGVQEFAWLFGPLIGGMTIGSILAGRLAHHCRPVVLIRAGFGVMGLGLLANAATTRWLPPVLPWAVAPLALYAMGMSLASPAMTLRTLAMLPKARGLAASLQTFVFMLLFAFLSGVVVPLLPTGAWPLALGALVGAVLGGGCWAGGTWLQRSACSR